MVDVEKLENLLKITDVWLNSFPCNSLPEECNFIKELKHVVQFDKVSVASHHLPTKKASFCQCTVEDCVKIPKIFVLVDVMIAIAIDDLKKSSSKEFFRSKQSNGDSKLFITHPVS